MRGPNGGARKIILAMEETTPRDLYGEILHEDDSVVIPVTFQRGVKVMRKAKIERFGIVSGMPVSYLKDVQFTKDDQYWLNLKKIHPTYRYNADIIKI